MELTAAEGRVLGCLIEAAAIAPESYPVSLNALRLACNRTSGRNPVVAYDDRTVEDTLLSLKSKGLARFVGPLEGDRAVRCSHRADDRWRMGSAELAVLSVVLVGGPLSLAEIHARACRLYPFDGLDEVSAVLDALAARTPSPFAARLDGGHAGPDARWAEVLTGEPDRGGGEPGGSRGGVAPAVVVPERVVGAPSYGELAARVAELERRLAAATERPLPREGGWPRTVPLGEPADDRYGPGGRRWGESVAGMSREPALPPGSPAGRSPAPPAPATGDLADLAERLADIERRLARIEAELGALR